MISYLSICSQAIKQRPSEVVVQLRRDDMTGKLRIGLNFITMLHRAAARLPSQNRKGRPIFSYRLETGHQVVSSTVHQTKPFDLPSNKPDAAAGQPPRFVIKLRPEQLRSLSWMLKRERPDEDDFFVEQEVSEAVLAPLGWRLEAKA